MNGHSPKQRLPLRLAEGRHVNDMIKFSDHVFAYLVSNISVHEGQSGSRVRCTFPRGLKNRLSGRHIEALGLKLSHNMDAYAQVGIVHLTGGLLA